MTDTNEGGSPKDNADVPPVLPNEQQTASDTGGVLSPEDLDISESPYVDEISEGRYVVSADRTPPNVPGRGNESLPARQSETRPERRDSRDARPPTDRSVQSPEAARSLLADELERTDTRYGLDIVARFGDDTARHRMTSNDVLDTFNSLVFWYARNVARNTRTDRAASLLFAKSDFDAALTAPQIRAALKEHDLDTTSTVGELLAELE
ncbi:DUF7500 family protein [Natronobacterium gregoryi]|uniref:Flagella cluster protein n=2 Tax=Natronobacterium gregoryi TaxID=44930 RepID=L0AI79_NATGS|nr:hypothetical protein [Natronobacterium gregoryi]AFZ73129.1 hypothetical protein Natgr_1946 [Natronobacterium gregoryi SP2]ELY70774.1 flagella cluster protein [Natronobacterium gregoryi SP2]PLK21541.1 flagella cluster protein [Natronobacterium gregoryi SP2]SFI60606.1 hypothetical protein SAMN05443661_102136 [Natronobacterium gregoryi]